MRAHSRNKLGELVDELFKTTLRGRRFCWGPFRGVRTITSFFSLMVPL